MKNQFLYFLLRWALNTFGLWISVRLLAGLGADVTNQATLVTFLLAGFIFSLVNAILKPIVIILSLPAILLTLGLFILVVNGLMVYITLALVPGLHISFLAAIVAGMIMSLVNYVLTGLLELRGRPRRLEQ